MELDCYEENFEEEIQMMKDGFSLEEEESSVIEREKEQVENLKESLKKLREEDPIQEIVNKLTINSY